MGSFKDLTSPTALRVLLPVGLFVAAWCGWQWWDERDLIQRAVEVQAEVLAVGIEDYTTGSGSNRERHWRPVVRYRYEHAGRVLESDRVTPLGKGGSHQWAQELAARFEAGAETSVWIDPDDPERAFLVEVRSTKTLVGIFVGLIIAFATGVGLLRQRGREGASTPPEPINE